MKHYIEITLLPNSDVNLFKLWSIVFTQIHLGLVEMIDEKGDAPIGVSFPGYVVGQKCSVLGDKLRLFAKDEKTLARFGVSLLLSNWSDNVHWTDIRAVPEKITAYAFFQREQLKGKELLARRCAKKHNIDYESALQRYSDMPQRSSATPFIHIKSLSGGQLFYLRIKKIRATEESLGSTFGSYGLSSTSAVPDF